ncbi:hypothetical protein EVA_18162 [gut metagenome]|uniref:Uncharacterized protein n=1 Tax=gut metagenome TaxID=749906 RepID=J9FFN7_9ZZZZ
MTTSNNQISHTEKRKKKRRRKKNYSKQKHPSIPTGNNAHEKNGFCIN